MPVYAVTDVTYPGIKGLMTAADAGAWIAVGYGEEGDLRILIGETQPSLNSKPFNVKEYDFYSLNRLHQEYVNIVIDLKQRLKSYDYYYGTWGGRGLTPLP